MSLPKTDSGRLSRKLRPAFEHLENRYLPSFSSPIAFPIAGAAVAPGQVVAADLTGDNLADIVVESNFTNPSLNILLNTGQGSFVQAPDFSIVVRGGALVLADLLGNGKQDIIVGDQVFLGIGNGTFRPGPDLLLPANDTAKAIATGDFNGDHHLDLAVLGSQGLYILLGNGTGSFKLVATLPVFSTASAVAVGDFNGDGKADLVVASETFFGITITTPGSLTVYSGNGDGSFQAGQNVLAGSFSWVGTADLTSNGRSDIIATAFNQEPEGVNVLLSKGDGTFSPGAGISNLVNPTFAALTDFNGDGKPDLLVVSQNGTNLSMYLGNGQGGFTQDSSSSFNLEGIPAIGDFNGDGKPDVLAFSFISENPLVFLNQFPGTSPPSNQAFVAQLYHSLLHRQADSGGLAGWMNLLNQGVSRTQVALDIEGSVESRTIEVQGLYLDVLARAADSAGLQHWVGFLMGGGTLDHAEASFIASPEYQAKFAGGSQDNSAFVTAVYQTVLHRGPDSAGLQNWTSALAGGASRDAVALAIIQSQESAQDQVTAMYSTYLARTPDSGGLAAFVNFLLSGGTQEGAIAIILGSPEYFGKG